MHGYAEKKDDHLRRLRRIEGQVRGLQRMIENDEYCIDVLTQISAATRALQAVSIALTEELSEISGVRKVDVDVASGRVTVASDGPLSADDVRAAVVEAGFQLVS